MLLKSLFSFIAFVLLAAVLWFLGPLFAFAEFRPLVSVWARCLAIGLIFVCIALPLLMVWLKHRRAENALKSGLTRDDEKARVQGAKLESIFTQAVNTLKKNQKRRSIFESKQGLYELPWYVLIGPPGSGKTTLLKNAGLRFPLGAQWGDDPLKGVGGTRNCDWWFTDKAVLLDTAGRFTTQDSDLHTDQAGWQAFLKLLTQYRPEQPVNGIVLTLSLEDLNGTDAQRHELAQTLGRRLQEMVKSLKVCPPVYVVVTKLDWIAGFNEIFDHLSEEERAMGLGLNLQHPNDPKQSLLETLPNCMNQWYEYLEARARQALGQRPSDQAKAQLSGFTQEFAQCQIALQNLLKTTFEGNSAFESPLVLRGVYFTSGTQSGSAFDRMLQALGRQTPTAKQSGPTAGKSYFVRDVLQDVIFAEQHLANTVKTRRWIRTTGHRLCLTLCLIVPLGLSAAWAVSYHNNQQWLADQALQVSHLQDQANALSHTADAPVAPLFKVLDALWAYEEGLGDQIDGLHTLGLSQTDKISVGAELAYRSALQNALLPRIALELQHGLEESLQAPASAQSSERVYESLKAYLMLYEPQHFDESTLTQWVQLNWQGGLLTELPVPDRQPALAHLARAIHNGQASALPAQNKALVQRARQYLGNLSLDTRVYGRLKALYQADSLPEFNVVSAAGPEALNVFIRRSGQSLNQGVASFYTKAAYYSYFYPNAQKEALTLSQETKWVVGEQTTHQDAAQTAMAARSLYLKDYIDQWQAFISDIQIKPTHNFDDVLNEARQLAAPQSPLKALLKAIAAQTTLASDASALLNKAASKGAQQVGSKLGPQLSQLVNQGQDKEPIRMPEQQVDDYFHDLNNLFANNGGGYAQVSSLLTDLYTQMAAVAAAQKSKGAPPSASALDGIALNASLMPEPVKSMISTLSTQGSQQSRQAERASLSADIHPLAAVCRTTVHNRYPFTPGSSADTLPEDFIRLFSSNGLLKQFFDSHLTNLVDTGTDPWRFKPLSDGTRPQETDALAQFQRADQIRQVMFAENPAEPGFSVRLTLVKSSNPKDVLYVDQDGQLTMFSMQFDPTHRIQWRARPASTSISLRSSDDARALVFKGPWALFRLFDAAQIKTTDRPERFLATIHLGEKWFELEVMANSAFNPLQLRALHTFHCPESL